MSRDEGLSCSENISGNNEKKKDEIFISIGLRISVKCNLTVTGVSDVTYDLRSNTYYLHIKPNNKLLHINKHSNHPSSIITHISSMIGKTFSGNLCDRNHSDKQSRITILLLK